jgi:hypothetical protein
MGDRLFVRQVLTIFQAWSPQAQTRPERMSLTLQLSNERLLTEMGKVPSLNLDNEICFVARLMVTLHIVLDTSHLVAIPLHGLA